MQLRTLTSLKNVLSVFVAFMLIACHGYGKNDKSASDPELDQLKKVYTQSLAKIENVQNASLQKALSAYSSKVSKYIKHFKGKGDLDNYKAMLDEKERLDSTGQVPASAEINNYHIKQAAMEYEAVVAKLQSDKDVAHTTLIKKYQPALESMVMKRVQCDDLEGATRAKQELERIKFIAASIVTQADFEKPEKKSKPEPKQKPVVKRIALSGSGMTIGKWRKQGFKIPKGSSVTVSAKPGMSFDNVSDRYNCVILRLGETGQQIYFRTDGSYYKTYSGYSSSKSQPSVVATEDCYLYVQHNQENRITLTVTIEPKEE